MAKHRKKHRAPGAGRPQIWPAGSLGCWVRVRPEVSAALQVNDRRGLRLALLGILSTARPDLPWNVTPPSPTA